METLIQRISLMAVPILLAVTCHEYAHGWVADRLGDPTARLSGRLTFNPLKHLDLFGTIVFILTRMIGWAKPVPVNPYNFRNPKRDMILVSLAGFMANIVLAVISGTLFRLMYPFGIPFLPFEVNYPLNQMIIESARINIGLAIFNVIPIPPLDGSKVLAGFLPPALYEQFSKIEPYGFLILLLLIVTGAVNIVIAPLFYLSMRIILGPFM
jgi:Zn-dependent protease